MNFVCFVQCSDSGQCLDKSMAHWQIPHSVVNRRILSGNTNLFTCLSSVGQSQTLLTVIILTDHIYTTPALKVHLTVAQLLFSFISDNRSCKVDHLWPNQAFNETFMIHNQGVKLKKPLCGDSPPLEATVCPYVVFSWSHVGSWAARYESIMTRTRGWQEASWELEGGRR